MIHACSSEPLYRVQLHGPNPRKTNLAHKYSVDTFLSRPVVMLGHFIYGPFLQHGYRSTFSPTSRCNSFTRSLQKLINMPVREPVLPKTFMSTYDEAAVSNETNVAAKVNPEITSSGKGWRFYVALGAICLANFMSALDASVVAVALAVRNHYCFISGLTRLLFVIVDYCPFSTFRTHLILIFA